MFLVDDDGPGPEDGGEVEQGEDADGVSHDAAAPVVPQLQVVAPQRLVVLLHLQHTCRLELTMSEWRLFFRHKWESLDL